MAFGLSGAGSVQKSGAILPGQAGGTELFGEYCVGYYDDVTHFCFELDSAANVRLEISESDVDTTLALHGADDFLFCDDDGGVGLLSRIEQRLSPGQYMVRIGTFSQHVSGRFTLQATRLP